MYLPMYFLHQIDSSLNSWPLGPCYPCLSSDFSLAEICSHLAVRPRISDDGVDCNWILRCQFTLFSLDYSSRGSLKID